jgi:hypothetical protein
MTEINRSPAAREEAKARLRQYLDDGSCVHLVLAYVQPSGMSRSIKPYFLFKEEGDNQISHQWLGYWVAQVLGWGFDGKRDAVRVVGAGMDMGFHLVHSLGHEIGRKLKHEWL